MIVIILIVVGLIVISITISKIIKKGSDSIGPIASLIKMIVILAFIAFMLFLAVKLFPQIVELIHK